MGPISEQNGQKRSLHDSVCVLRPTAHCDITGRAGCKGEAPSESFPSAPASVTSQANSHAQGHAPVVPFAAHDPGQGRTSG